MNIEEFYERYQIPCLPLIVDRIVAIVKESYQYNSERHNDEWDDNLTFAVNNWRNIWNRIELELSAEFPDSVSCSRPNNSLQIVIADSVIIHLYSRKLDDVLSGASGFNTDTFTKKIAARENYVQLELIARRSTSAELEIPLPQLVILHAGTPSDGLLSMSIAEPVSITDDIAQLRSSFNIYSGFAVSSESDINDKSSEEFTPFEQIGIDDIALAVRSNEETREEESSRNR